MSPNNRSQRLKARSLPMNSKTSISVQRRARAARQRLRAARLFDADVAHELRTPVTILIGQTEVALTRDRSIGELRHALQSNSGLDACARSSTTCCSSRARIRANARRDWSKCRSRGGGAHAGVPGDAARRGQSARISEGRCACIRQHLALRAGADQSRDECDPALRPGATISVSIARERGRISIAVANPGEAIEPSMPITCSTASIARRVRGPTAARITGSGLRSSRRSRRCIAARCRRRVRAGSTRSRFRWRGLGRSSSRQWPRLLFRLLRREFRRRPRRATVCASVQLGELIAGAWGVVFTPFDALGLLWNLLCFWFICSAPVRGGTHFLCCCKESKQRKQLSNANPCQSPPDRYV